MNITPIIFTHILVTTNRTKEDINKTGEAAIVYVCAGPGDENSIAIKWGRLLKTGPMDAILPLLAVREGILDQPKGQEHGVIRVPVIRGSILSKVNTLATFAMNSIKAKYGNLKINKKYRVSLSGEVEVLEDVKVEEPKV